MSSRSGVCGQVLPLKMGGLQHVLPRKCSFWPHYEKDTEFVSFTRLYDLIATLML